MKEKTTSMENLTTESRLETLERKLDELIESCLEMDQLSVKLRSLERGSPSYFKALADIEIGGQILKAKALSLADLIEGIRGARDPGRSKAVSGADAGHKEA